MRGGQNRKTAAEKRLAGTFRKDREPKNAPTPAPAVVGEPPKNFTKAQRAAWVDLAPQVQLVFADSDRAAFGLLVKLVAELDAPSAAKLPAHARASLARTVVGLLERFGCTPASRGRVEAVQKEAEKLDETELFLFGRASRPPAIDPLKEFEVGKPAHKDLKH